MLEKVKQFILGGQWTTTISEKSMLKIIALVIVICFYMGTQAFPQVSWSYGEDVRGQLLTPLYDAEKYVIEGLPKTIDVTLEGKEALVRSVIQKQDFKFYVDLTQLKPGQHIVEIEYDVIPNDIHVDINPQNVSILIKERIQVEKAIEIDYLNHQALDSIYVLDKPLAETTHVKIMGAKDIVDKVVAVKGLVDVSDPTQLTDYITPLYAMDKEGNKLEVTIEPSEIKVSIPVSTPNQLIPLKATYEGQAPEGMVLSEIDLNQEEIVVYAPTEVLAQLSSYPIYIPETQLDENGEGTITLTPLEGVNRLEPSTIEVKVNFAKLERQVIKKIPLKILNLEDKWKLQSTIPKTIEIEVEGTVEQLKTISNEVLSAHLDVKDLETGTHEVKVQVAGLPKGIGVVTQVVEVVLKKK